MMFFEDIPIGSRVSIGAFTFTAEDIKRFARAYDPQPFHLDEAAAEASHFGRLCASGWHTVAVWMKLNVAALRRRGEEERASTPTGGRSARLGPSPGFDELKWKRPVYAGDTITYENEVIAKRASRSRPGWGLISIRNTGTNQDGVEVLSFVGHVFVEMREAGAE